MSEVVDAARTFFDHLASVGWTALGVALAFHLARLLARSLAWRVILTAAFPGVPISRARIFAAYVAGVVVNSIAPARAGDVLKLVLAKRSIAGSSYATLTPTLLVETLLDVIVAGGILIWATTQNVLPSLDVLPDLPAIDWHWPANHPKAAVVIAVVWMTVIVLLLIHWSKHVKDFWARVAAGFAILSMPRKIFLGVVPWQALSWFCRAATVFFFLHAFHLPATARTTLLVLAVQSLSTLLPFTPGGVGTQQGLIVYVFRNEPISKSTLISFSVGMQIALTVFNVVLGLAALLWTARTVHWKRLVTPARDELEQQEASQ